MGDPVILQSPEHEQSSPAPYSMLLHPKSQLLQTCAEAEHHLGHPCRLKDQHIAKAVERGVILHTEVHLRKAGDS